MAFVPELALNGTDNGLVCFTNCLLPQEDGGMIEKDLWIDESTGVILDAQRTFFLRKERPSRVIDLKGNVLSPGLIDIQINGAYDFDFSIYTGDDDAYMAGIQMISERIVEMGVTSIVPTVITQERSLYPKLLSMLKPYTHPEGKGASFLGWHAEGPFLQAAKRGAHVQSFLQSAPKGFESFEDIYGEASLAVREDWEMGSNADFGVRIITAAPEIEGVMDVIGELSRRGIVFSIGHSIASTDVATHAVQNGARLITHLFNAMPQLHHRDPSIIGLLGASPHVHLSPATILPAAFSSLAKPSRTSSGQGKTIPAATGSEALDELETPPQTPVLRPSPPSPPKSAGRSEFHLDKGEVADMPFERPFFGMIVDGVHSHPNSVRLAYSAHREGCVLITDAMKVLDPRMRDGIHNWRDGKRVIKEGDKLYIEGTDTLAGSVVTLDKCVRNFAKFTGCSLGEAIKCATYSPAKCLNIQHKKGTLRPGADADLVVLDRQGKVLSTWVKGKQVWSA